LTGWLATCASAVAKPAADPGFRYSRDTFAFANETVWNYVEGEVHPENRPGREKKTAYTRRCFIVARAALQFWKFARFDPKASPPSDAELARLIRAVTRRDVWRVALPGHERVVIPGYASLRAASAARPRVFQENIGLGWPCYFRPGNYCIVFPVTQAHQAKTRADMELRLKKGEPVLLWLVNFPKLDINHACLVYAKASDTAYTVYDPNYANEHKQLRYDPVTRQFDFSKTFYFKGGAVKVRPIFLSPIQ
jgi:hypothetical protein